MEEEEVSEVEGTAEGSPCAVEDGVELSDVDKEMEGEVG